MKRESSGVTALGLAEILVPGLIGLFVVARTLAFYWGHDLNAALIVVAMGLGLSVGLVELLLRSRGAGLLSKEVQGLPPQLDDQGLTRLSPTLRDLLRARIEQAPAPFRIESITPFLVGLMVMLGLLGTLLGLFETLRGAGHALTASSNVDALRTGLSEPMRGLTRSFGCSAAGVSASAMLGLAAALVRRREAKVVAQVYSYANGPLRSLSPVRSQLNALQQLAEQGLAMPKAAGALELTAQHLSGLSERWEKSHDALASRWEKAQDKLAERWEKSHQAAADAQQRGLEQALASMRSELTKAAVETARAMQSSLAQQVEQLVQKSGETVSQHVAKTARLLDEELKARRQADADLRKTVHEELARLPEQLASLVETSTRSMAEHVSHTSQALERELTARRQADAELRSAFQDELSTLRDSLLRSHEAQSALVATQIASVEQALQQATEQQVGLLSAQRTQADAHMAALGETSRALAARLDEDARARREESTQLFGELAQKLDHAGSHLGVLAEGVGEQLRARLAAESEVAQQSQAAMALLEQSGKALEEALARHDLAVETLVEQAGQQLARMASSAQESTAAAVQRVVELAAQQGDRLTSLEAQLEAAQAKHVQSLAQELSTHAERLGKGLEGTNGLVSEAANLLKASSVEMAAVAEMFAASVERQREAASSWLESLGELEGAVERAGRGAAADALGDQLASTQEVFARQLQFQRELFEQLRSLRHPPSTTMHGEHDVSA